MKFNKRLAYKVYVSSWYRKFFRERGDTRESLVLLNPGVPSEQSEEQFHVQKISQFLDGMCLAFLILIFGVILWIREKNNSVITYIERPGYEQSDTTDTLIIRREDGTTEKVTLDITAREYTSVQEREFLSQASDYLDEVILGENESSDHVDRALNFPESCLDGLVTISWTTNHPSVLTSKGKIKDDFVDESGTIVQVKGVMECQDSEAIYIRSFVIYPQKQENESEFLVQLKSLLSDAEASSREDEGFALPQSVGNEQIVVSRPVENELLMLGILVLVGIVMLTLIKDEKLKEKVKAREEELLHDYPELVSKLNILMGAGLTPRLAFGKITADYRKKKASDKKIRYAYEEVSIAYYEMMNGISESKAYERFGKRCGILPYLRLGGMLSASTQSGNKELAGILENESREAFDERKRHAKELGEKAGTKLLMPMMLMLLVTILIIIYPAFVSFQI